MAIKQLARKKDGLGLWSLTGLVVGSMIGAGIFNLVQGTGGIHLDEDPDRSGEIGRAHV